MDVFPGGFIGGKETNLSKDIIAIQESLPLYTMSVFIQKSFRRVDVLVRFLKKWKKFLTNVLDRRKLQATELKLFSTVASIH